MNTREKLEILADASQYDLSCACGTQKDEHRRNSKDGLWLYPVSLPRGGFSIMLKTLLSSSCVNDCLYCPFRSGRDIRRCSLSPDELAAIYMEYVRRQKVFGLFLSSGVMRDPDYTMDRMIATAEILRKKYCHRGYLHLKVIPGASDAAIEKMVSLASAVSLNVEVPKKSYFEALSKKKDFEVDIVRPVRLISSLTAKGSKYSRVKQTTQFIVGAANENDADIVRAVFGLYRNLHFSRVYFSAYQKGLGDPSIPGERVVRENPSDLLTREHRLYQTDFLIRKYKWDLKDIVFEDGGNLSLSADPKQLWAERHPEFYPVRILSADKDSLLRVPGIGPLGAQRILDARKNGNLRELKDAGLAGKRLEKAMQYSVMK